MAEGGTGTGGEIAAAAGGVAGLIPALVGRGQSKRIAKGYGPGQPGYDPGASFFGGARGQAQKYAATMNSRGQAIDERGPNLASYGEADRDRIMQRQARQGQLMLAQGQLARAQGQVPSIAQQQADRQMGQAVAAQGAQQASARGAAGLALAGQTAAGNVAGAQSAISGQAQVNAANERMQAEQAAQQAYGNIRGGDQQAQGQDAGQAQFQAGMQQTNRDANDSRAQGTEKMGHDALMGELTARTANQGTMAGSYNTANAANQQTANQNAGAKGIIETIGDVFKSDERAKVPLLGIGGMSPASAAAAPSFDALASGGGMDPMGSLQKHSDFATQFVNNPGAQPMVSDERAKTPMLARGGRNGGINPGDHRPPPGVAPRASFSARDGWTFPSKPAPEPEMSAQENDDADIMRQVDERRAIDARNAKDPAVGLGRIAQDRGLIRRGYAPEDTDENGMAPGTADFEQTKDKEDPGPGKRPWWMGLGAASKALNEAQFGNRPVMVSDARAKTGAFEEGVAYADALAAGKPIKAPSYYETSAPKSKPGNPYTGYEKPADDSNAAMMARVRARDAEAGPLIGPPDDRAPKPSAAQAARRLAAADTGAPGPWSASLKAHAAAPPSEMADANRKMAGEAYAYKPGMSPDQAPGEPNFGPMAQNLEQNPITATAVKTDPATGLKVVDKEKALKVTMAGVADLQKQNDEMRRMLVPGGRR